MTGTSKKAASSVLDDRVRAVERLTQLFRLERIVYLVVTGVSLVILILSAVILIVRSKADPAVLTLLFGSSGLIGYSASRLLQMWNQAMRLLMAARLDEEDK